MICFLAYKSPRQEGDFLSGRVGWGGLVEADAGYVGWFDGIGDVIFILWEGNGEVFDLVRSAEFHQESDEVTEMLDEVVIAFVGGDVA